MIHTVFNHCLTCEECSKAVAELEAKAAFGDACIAQSTFAAFWLDKLAEGHETEAVVKAHILHAAEHEERDPDVKEERRDLMVECCREVCMYCSGHAKGYYLVPVGPNSAANYVHEPKEDFGYKDGALCYASAIWHKIKRECGQNNYEGSHLSPRKLLGKE